METVAGKVFNNKDKEQEGHGETADLYPLGGIRFAKAGKDFAKPGNLT